MRLSGGRLAQLQRVLEARFGSRAQILAAFAGASPYHAATFNPLPKDRPMRPNFLKLLPILALAAPALAPAQTTFRSLRPVAFFTSSTIRWQI